MSIVAVSDGPEKMYLPGYEKVIVSWTYKIGEQSNKKVDLPRKVTGEV